MAPGRSTRSPRWALAVALAWGSHILLDWLSNDTRPPLGVMALWPFTRDYYKAGDRDLSAGVAALLGVAVLDLQPERRVVELLDPGPLTLLVRRSAQA